MQAEKRFDMHKDIFLEHYGPSKNKQSNQGSCEVMQILKHSLYN